ncbi:SDR family NAD(P)-dependent oxidoreductase [Actinacidiphila sp. DG2A-62]|uniref:SDR family NAD(P)-dependent oxidoreductase n=1 Tax=Actinacidiphila sp. DG2A-62 TaxID=3108821 RepID=UPI002DB8546C|nr:SDR family NAD(P)-dependent oxidoreductase [Actinacidiphila sp. DG2A-62]MEC3998644.1 SDR family NAD(P)-dependent oxidoreductase [Actinacidiphila sp. DG2A-62]
MLVDDSGARTRLGYGELRERALRTLTGLRGLGLRAGDRVLLQLDEHAGFLTVLWACLLGGLVAAPLAVPADSGGEDAQTERLYGAWRTLGEPVVVADAARVAGLRASAAARGLSGLRAVGADELTAAARCAEPHRARPDDPVLLMLTSGSTGRPKAVVLRHRNVLARSAATAAANGLRGDDVSVNWLPLDHVGGVVMFHLRDVFLGCRQVHAPTRWVLQDPLRWPELAHEMRATTTWAPNFAFGLVADRAAELPTRARGWDLSRLRFVMNAGEAIVPRVARRWLEVLAPYGLPADAMRPAWGMSETSSAMTYSDRFRLHSTSDGDAFVDVGVPLPGTAIRIVATDQDTRQRDAVEQGAMERDSAPGGGRDGFGGAAAGPRVLAEGETGRLQVRGATVTTGYDAAPEQNAAAFTADGWFDTGDLGRISDGRLTLTGRAKDVVILGGVNHHSHEIEAVVEQLDCVEPSFTAAVAVRPAGAAGDELAVFFHPRGAAEPAEAVRRVRAAVREGVGVSARHVVVVEREEIPKTEIGKIRRAALRTRFEAGGFAGRVPGGRERTTTVPGHFHRPVWLPRTLPPLPAPAPAPTAAAGPVLLIPDRYGLAAVLARTLTEGGHRVETADPEAYAAPGPRTGGRPSGPKGSTATRHDPPSPGGGTTADPDPVGGVPGAVAGAAGRVVVDLRAYGGTTGPGPREARAERHGLLGLARAVRDAAAVYVVTSHARRVSAADPPAQERAPLDALTASLGHERPGTRVAHIDLPPGDLASDAALLAAEVTRLPRDHAVAHRAGRRLVRALAPVDAPDRAATAVAAGTGAGNAGPSGGGFRRGGRYLVTGGSGGVGRLVAAELAGAYGADVVCVARGPAGTRVDDGRFAHAVTHVTADVRDMAAMRRVLRDAEDRWGAALDGVLHLAGSYREASLDACSAQELDEDLAVKADGARVLHELLRERPGLLFVSFSSVNGLFGGASVGGYAAANAYLDELAVHQRLECDMRAYSLAWSMWDETGMSAGYPLKRLTRDRGYRVLAPEQALASLAVALGRAAPHQLLGLDPARPWIASQCADAPLSAPELTVYGEVCAPADGAEGCDRFGVPHVVRHVVVDALPVDAAGGEVDRDALAAGRFGARAEAAGAGGAGRGRGWRA